MSHLTNYTYDEITVGQTASYSRTVSERDIQLFAVASGDINPLHLDENFARETQFGQRIAHGMLTASFISAALAMKLPGPGCVFLAQTLKFRLPVHIGDAIRVDLKVVEKTDRRGTITFDCNAFNQQEKKVVTGTATVMAPTQKLSLPMPTVPSIDGVS